MDWDEEKKNNPFEQDAHNEPETEIESTADAAALTGCFQSTVCGD